MLSFEQQRGFRINVLLTPQQIQIDHDSAFRGVFSEMRRDLGVPLVPIPADAHFLSRCC